MSTPKRTPRVLPTRPSKEHLRKQAKRLAKEQSLGLAAAQRRLARRLRRRQLGGAHEAGRRRVAVAAGGGGARG